MQLSPEQRGDHARMIIEDEAFTTAVMMLREDAVNRAIASLDEAAMAANVRELRAVDQMVANLRSILLTGKIAAKRNKP